VSAIFIIPSCDEVSDSLFRNFADPRFFIVYFNAGENTRRILPQTTDLFEDA